MKENYEFWNDVLTSCKEQIKMHKAEMETKQILMSAARNRRNKFRKEKVTNNPLVK